MPWASVLWQNWCELYSETTRLIGIIGHYPNPDQWVNEGTTQTPSLSWEKMFVSHLTELLQFSPTHFHEKLQSSLFFLNHLFVEIDSQVFS